FIVAAAVPVIVGFLAIAVARYLYSTELANPDMTIFFMWLGGAAPAWRRLTRSPARRRARGRRAPAPHPGTSCGRPYCPSYGRWCPVGVSAREHPRPHGGSAVGSCQPSRAVESPGSTTPQQPADGSLPRTKVLTPGSMERLMVSEASFAHRPGSTCPASVAHVRTLVGATS